jgi:hypothetical protein
MTRQEKQFVQLQQLGTKLRIAQQEVEECQKKLAERQRKVAEILQEVADLAKLWGKDLKRWLKILTFCERVQKETGQPRIIAYNYFPARSKIRIVSIKRQERTAIPTPLGFFATAPATLSQLPVPVVAGGRTSCKRVSLLGRS